MTSAWEGRTRGAAGSILIFSRTGFTEAARAEAEPAGAQLIDLNQLDADLRQALEP